MQNLILVIQTILAVILIVFIFIQSKGTGFGRSFGGGGSTSFTRRGLEKIVFRMSFVVSALFIIVSFISVVL